MTSRRSPVRLSRTGMTTVTSRCDGPPAGRGWATVASSSARASSALAPSRTSTRPSGRESSIRPRAVGDSRSSRVGEPPSSAAAPTARTRRSSCTANPSGRRGALMSTSRRPAAASAAPDRRSRRPSRRTVARRGRAVAVVGSPRTPESLTAPTPPARSCGIRSANAPVLPGRLCAVRTRSGERCSSSEVSVCPAWASDPAAVGVHQAASRSSVRSRATAARSASRLPPWPLTNTTRRAQSDADRPYSTSTACNAAVPMETVPAKPWCSPEAP